MNDIKLRERLYAVIEGRLNPQVGANMFKITQNIKLIKDSVALDKGLQEAILTLNTYWSLIHIQNGKAKFEEAVNNTLLLADSGDKELRKEFKLIVKNIALINVSNNADEMMKAIDAIKVLSETKPEPPAPAPVRQAVAPEVVNEAPKAAPVNNNKKKKHN